MTAPRLGLSVVAVAVAGAVACGQDAGASDSSAAAAGAVHVDWFRDVTETSGLVALDVPAGMTSRGSGIAVGDVNRDGTLDVLACAGSAATSLHLGRGHLRFDDAASSSGLGESRCRGAALGDLDGDGDLDAVLVSDGDAAPGAACVRLFWNDGAGRFAEGVGAVPCSGGEAQSALLADFDADGRTDVYVVTTGGPDGAPDTRADHLLRNLGGQRFADLGSSVGVDTSGYGWVAAAIDADHDGRADVFVGNDTFAIGGSIARGTSDADGPAPDLLLRNDGPGNDGELGFTEVGEPWGASAHRSTMGALVGDFTADGVADLYLSDYGPDHVLAGRAEGGFDDRTEALGLAAGRRTDGACAGSPQRDDCVLVAWGAAFEDFDLDGFADLVVLHGALLGADRRQPVSVWRGGPEGVSTPVSSDLGRLDGRALVPADLDDDGDLDLVASTRGGRVRVFENVSAGGATRERGWLRVRLHGAASNPEGIGAEVRVLLGSGRTLVRWVGSGGVVHSWAPAQAHFGLGRESVARLEVRWPSGAVQEVAEAPPDRIVDVVEPVPPARDR